MPLSGKQYGTRACHRHAARLRQSAAAPVIHQEEAAGALLEQHDRLSLAWVYDSP